MLPHLIDILKKQHSEADDGTVILNDIEPLFKDDQFKRTFFQGRHTNVVTLPVLIDKNKKYKLFDDYKNMTQEDIENVLDIPDAELIGWLLYPDKSFVLTDYHKQTITAMITKIECGVCEYKGSNIRSLIESLIHLSDMVKHHIPVEQLNDIISDDIIESSIIHVCFRKHFYDDIDVIIPTSADIKYGLSKMKNPYYIKKMQDFAELYHIPQTFQV